MRKLKSGEAKWHEQNHIVNGRAGIQTRVSVRGSVHCKLPLHTIIDFPFIFSIIFIFSDLSITETELLSLILDVRIRQLKICS